MKITADAGIPFLRGALEPYATMQYAAELTPSLIADSDALIVRTRTRCDAALLDGSAVKQIATATIGFDHIDLAYCFEHDIAVHTAAGSNARGVLQYMAAVLCRLVSDPRGVRLGVVGAGHVGSLVEAYAKKWGFEVMVCDPPLGREYTLEQVAAKSDILTFHVPLNTQTHHMRFKTDALIVNTSRGEVIPPHALHGNRYVFDVWQGEPTVDRRLLQGALLATPHIAGYSLQGKANATAAVVRALMPSLKDWYPAGIRPSRPREISWAELRASIQHYFDIAAQSDALKAAPECFESMRNNYVYREEYF